jgi:probable addiction module antidote protein
MGKIGEKADSDIRLNAVISKLNKALEQEDTATFQKILLGFASLGDGLPALAEQTGLRRETLWRNGVGRTDAPLKNILKIMTAVGLTLSVGRHP